MGKAVKWFRGLLGLKKHESPLPPTLQSRSASKNSKEKRKWKFVKSYREREAREAYSYKVGEISTTTPCSGYVVDDDKIDQNKHAIAVAAATAAVAEAAVAAAQAAAAVVRLTSSGRCGNPPLFIGGNCGDREEFAAVRIQSAFRGFLGRKALRALKAVVRLQALVRGHIERKRTAAWLQRMQALLRAQARARAGRAQIFESLLSSGKSSQFHHPGPVTPEKFEHVLRVKSVKYDQPSLLKRNDSKSSGRVIVDQDKAYIGGNKSDRRMDERSWDQGPSMRTGTKDDENSDKILEIDTGKPHFAFKRRNLFHTSQPALSSDQISHSYTTSKDSTAHQNVLSPSSCEVQSSSPLKFSRTHDEIPFCPDEHSPQFLSASSRGNSLRKSPFTPTKSDGSRSYLSEYSHHPNFMSYTESSKAKARSLSAPKQRPQFEKSSSTKRYSSVHAFGEPKLSAQKVSALNATFTNKVYPGSGRLDRLGMPVGYRH